MIAAEILAESIRANKEVVGTNLFEKYSKFPNTQMKPFLYIELIEKTLRACLITLKDIQKVSGLKINIDKTKVVKIWCWRDILPRFSITLDTRVGSFRNQI